MNPVLDESLRKMRLICRYTLCLSQKKAVAAASTSTTPAAVVMEEEKEEETEEVVDVRRVSPQRPDATTAAVSSPPITTPSTPLTSSSAATLSTSSRASFKTPTPPPPPPPLATTTTTTSSPEKSGESSSSSSSSSSREEEAGSPPLDLSQADAGELAAELAAILGETPDSTTSGSAEADSVPLGPALKQLSQSARPPPPLLLHVVKHLDQLVQVLVASGRTPTPPREMDEEGVETEAGGGDGAPSTPPPSTT